MIKGPDLSTLHGFRFPLRFYGLGLLTEALHSRTPDPRTQTTVVLAHRNQNNCTRRLCEPLHFEKSCLGMPTTIQDMTLVTQDSHTLFCMFCWIICSGPSVTRMLRLPGLSSNAPPAICEGLIVPVNFKRQPCADGLAHCHLGRF